VLPLATGFTSALNARDLADGIAVPRSVSELLDGRGSGYSPA